MMFLPQNACVLVLNISWMGRGVVGTDSILRKKGIMDKIHKVVFRVLTEGCFMNYKTCFASRSRREGVSAAFFRKGRN